MHHILEHTDLLCSMCKHESGLAAHKVSPGGINVLLVGLKPDGQCSDVIIELVVVSNLPGQAPVVSLGHSHLQDLKVASRPHKHVAEPGRQGFNGGVSAGVCLGIEVDDVRLLIGPLGVGIARHSAVIIKLNPLGWVIEPVTNRDVCYDPP